MKINTNSQMLLSFITPFPSLYHTKAVPNITPNRSRLNRTGITRMSGITKHENFNEAEYLQDVQKNFTYRAPRYDKTGMTYPDHLTFLQDLTQLYPPQYPLLDIACGTGLLCNALKSQGEGIYGIDLTEGMLTIASSKYEQGKFTQGRAEELPYDNESFNSAYICSALPYFVDVEKALKEAWRVLAYDGFLAYQAVSKDSYVIGVVLREAVVNVCGDNADFVFKAPNAFTDGIKENTELLENAGFTEIEMSEKRFEKMISVEECKTQWDSIVMKNPLTKIVGQLDMKTQEKIKEKYVKALLQRADQQGMLNNLICSWYVCGYKRRM